MKLPPIWAEYALFVNPDKTKRIPPIIAESMDHAPKTEAIFAPREFVRINIRTANTIPRISRRNAFSTWMISTGPTAKTA